MSTVRLEALGDGVTRLVLDRPGRRIGARTLRAAQEQPSLAAALDAALGDRP